MAINVLVEIRQVSEVVKASFLGITKVREMARFARMSIIRKINRLCLIRDGVLEHIVSIDRGLDYANEVRSLEQTRKSADGQSPN